MIEWAITSSVLILVVLALRRLLMGKISLRLQYGLWALVLVRLLLPVSLGGTAVSILNTVEGTQMPNPVVGYLGGDTPRLPGAESGVSPSEEEPQGQNEENHDQQQAEVDTAGGEKGTPISLGTVLLGVWAVGAVSMGLWLLWVNVRFAGKLRRSRVPLTVEHCPRPVYVTGAAQTPCLFGLFRPCIYVTPEVAADETVLRHSLAHELTHFRHGDHVWAVLRGLCLALHWYNPLVWLAAALSRRDGELCCDEATVTKLGEGERAAYGRTLLAVTCQGRTNPILTATSMTGSKGGIKERILLLAKRPKTAGYTLAAVALIAALAVGCTFTGAQKSGEGTAISLAEGIDVPQAVADYAREYVQEERTYYEERQGYEITGAKIVGITQINTGTAAENSGVNMYQLEYRLKAAHPDEVVLAGGMTMEDGAITEWGSAGQPYLLLYWEDSGAETTWERVCVTHTDTIVQDYGTPEMLETYGDKYTAAAMELASHYLGGEGWGDEPATDPTEGVTLTGLAVEASGSEEEIGRQWAEAFAAQYRTLSPENPLYSTDSVVLECTPYARSLLSQPQELIYLMRFACNAVDKAGFEQWYTGGAGPLTREESPQYEGWMGLGWFVVLEEQGEDRWACINAGAGGYGNWGYLNYETGETWELILEEQLSMDSSQAYPEMVLQILPFVNWNQLDGDELNRLWELLDLACITQGRVYGPEEDRMWSDVYPEDQAYRDLYVMLAALNTDGAYAEWIRGLLEKQQAYDPQVFESCLQNLTAEQQEVIRMLAGM